MSQVELATWQLFGNIVIWITPPVTQWHFQYVILRGGAIVANFNTSDLIKHLKIHQAKQHGEIAITKLYETVRKHVSWRLKDLQAISFTADIWTSDTCPMSLLSPHTGWTQYIPQHLPFRAWCCKQKKDFILGHLFIFRLWLTGKIDKRLLRGDHSL